MALNSAGDRPACSPRQSIQGEEVLELVPPLRRQGRRGVCGGERILRLQDSRGDQVVEHWLWRFRGGVGVHRHISGAQKVRERGVRRVELLLSSPTKK